MTERKKPSTKKTTAKSSAPVESRDDDHRRKMVSSGKSMTRWLARNAPDELQAVLDELKFKAAAPAT
jgi:hypothetical protein